MKFEKRLKRIPVSFDEETISILEVLSERERRPVTEIIYLMIREKVYGVSETIPDCERKA